MLWCITKEGTTVVHDEDGNWIGTFRDSKTAIEVTNQHNNLITNKPSEIPVKQGWGKSASWN